MLASVAAPAQTTVDTENSYSNVGAIMVWRVDDSGKPVELRAFASGTLIRSRVMVTAGHFTAPAKALGGDCGRYRATSVSAIQAVASS
jgi:hypothetical protein